MAAWHVLRIILLVDEDVARPKSLVRLDLGQFAVDCRGEQFRDGPVGVQEFLRDREERHISVSRLLEVA
jgi:hypothetical protein